MPFTTYAELLTAVGDWLARDDLAAQIPDFITLFETTAARRLKTRNMEATASLTPASGTVALPTGFLGVRRLTWTGDTRVDLSYVHPSILQASFPTSPSDTPRVYTIEGDNLLIRPEDSTALEMIYSKKTTSLSAGVQWLFSNHPDAYLFGALAEAKGFVNNGEALAGWMARRDKVLDEVEKLDFRYRGPMAITPGGPTP